MGNSIAETEVEVTRSSLKESGMIKMLGATQKDLDFPVECAQKPLTHSLKPVRMFQIQKVPSWPTRWVYQPSQGSMSTLPRNSVQ